MQPTMILQHKMLKFNNKCKLKRSPNNQRFLHHSLAIQFFHVSRSTIILTVLVWETSRWKEISNIKSLTLSNITTLQFLSKKWINMRWPLSCALYWRECLMDPLTLNTLTHRIRLSRLMEWVCSLRAGCIQGHLLLLVVVVSGVLTAKWLMEDLLILITTLNSFYLESNEI